MVSDLILSLQLTVRVNKGMSEYGEKGKVHFGTKSVTGVAVCKFSLKALIGCYLAEG